MIGTRFEFEGNQKPLVRPLDGHRAVDVAAESQHWRPCVLLNVLYRYNGRPLAARSPIDHGAPWIIDKALEEMDEIRNERRQSLLCTLFGLSNHHQLASMPSNDVVESTLNHSLRALTESLSLFFAQNLLKQLVAHCSK